MTAPIAAPLFTEPASKERLERTTAALIANNFAVEIHDNAAAARARATELIPEGASVLTASSETLRQSGIDDDNNTSGRYQALKRRLLAMDRTICADDIRRLMACPDFVVGSVAAATETGALVVPSASGGQLPSYAGGSRVILVVGAPKIVPDLETALRRVEEHCLPLEDERAQTVYGQPSAINRLLILNAEPHPGRVTILLLGEAIGIWPRESGGCTRQARNGLPGATLVTRRTRIRGSARPAVRRRNAVAGRATRCPPVPRRLRPPVRPRGARRGAGCRVRRSNLVPADGKLLLPDRLAASWR